VKATPEALNHASGSAVDWFCLAAQCKIRGWDALAAAAYREGRRELAKANAKRVEQFPVTDSLRRTAWDYWRSRLVMRGTERTDRKEVQQRLTYLASSNRPAGTWVDLELLDDLKLTLAPRQSKPGSVEALIDELTEYWNEQSDYSDPTGHGAYEKLVDLGFGAVPALLDHVGDRRLTRADTSDFYRQKNDIRRVGELAGWILTAISNGDHDVKARGASAKEQEW
jgi:hypothetical protein